MVKSMAFGANQTVALALSLTSCVLLEKLQTL